MENFLKKKGFSLRKSEIIEVTNKVKELADKDKKVFKDDIIAIAADVSGKLDQKIRPVELEEVLVNTGNMVKPLGVIRLVVDGEEKIGISKGVGPVDAMANAVKEALNKQFALKEYSLKAITGGTNALADVTVRVADKSGNVFTAEAVHEDITMASAQAIINGINKLIVYNRSIRPGRRGKRGKK